MERCVLIMLTALLVLAGCERVVVVGEPFPEEYPPPPEGRSGPSVAYESSGLYPVALHIPPGHLPPPGECRIWYPDRPPGHQPPPGDCASLSRRVPLGAWLIRHPGDDRKNVHVSVYDQTRPGVVIVIRVFNAVTGSFVSERIP
jgi:hypothetical protein